MRIFYYFIAIVMVTFLNFQQSTATEISDKPLVELYKELVTEVGNLEIDANRLRSIKQIFVDRGVTQDNVVNIGMIQVLKQAAQVHRFETLTADQVLQIAIAQRINGNINNSFEFRKIGGQEESPLLFEYPAPGGKYYSVTVYSVFDAILKHHDVVFKDMSAGRNAVLLVFKMEGALKEAIKMAKTGRTSTTAEPKGKGEELQRRRR
ncbi:MAG: hypothetical protein ABFQ95_07900 [Pseudomonadota bacterium]